MSQSILDVISKGLAEEMQLTEEYHPTRPVEFRLVRAGMIDPSSTKKLATPAAHILPGRDMIRDPYDPKIKNKLIRNIVGYNPVAQRPGEKPALEAIEDFLRFDSSGSVWIQPGEIDQWLYCKLYNKNRDNLNRNPNKAIVFYEVNEEKELVTLNNNSVLEYLASALIFNADPGDLQEIAQKVKNIYEQYQFDVMLENEKLIQTMISIAKSNPSHIILAAREPSSLARLLADQAVHRRAIIFDDNAEKLQWFWKRSQGEKGKKIIVKLAPGNSPIKGLVDYLISADGSEHFAELKKLGEEYYPKPR